MLDTDDMIERCECEFQALQPLCRGIRGIFSENLVDRDIIQLDVSRFLYLLQNYCSAIH